LIEESGFGRVWVVDNGASSIRDNISSVFEQVTSYFQLTAGSDK